MKQRDTNIVVWTSLALMFIGGALMFSDFVLGSLIAMPGFVCLHALSRAERTGEGE
jgi:hypothetical protein